MKPKILCCPTCPKKARTLSEVNKHIAASGCNEGKKISKLQIMIQAGILDEDCFAVSSLI